MKFKFSRKKTIAWKPTEKRLAVASARLRAYLPCRLMKQRGYPCEIYQESHQDDYELVVFQKAYREEDIETAKRLRARGVKTVLDLCDNHLYVPEPNPVLEKRAERLRRMLDVVDHVTVCSPELAKHVPSHHPPVVIDDLVEIPQINPLRDAYYAMKYRKKGADVPRIRLAWFGNVGMENPRFGIVDLIDILPELERLNQERPISLSIYTNDRKLYSQYLHKASFPTECRQWRLNRFPYQFRQADICLIPITQNPFTVCKTNNRLALSLLLGIPVVADMIPSYEDFAEAFLQGNWVENILRYADNPDLVQSHLTQARRIVQSKFSEEQIARQWMDFIEQVLGQEGTSEEVQAANLTGSVLNR